jgi:hypothetical protein
VSALIGVPRECREARARRRARPPLADLDDEVKLLADPKAGRKADGTLAFSRQALAGFVNSYVGTTLGGFVLTAVKDTRLARTKKRYRLTRLRE